MSAGGGTPGQEPGPSHTARGERKRSEGEKECRQVEEASSKRGKWQDGGSEVQMRCGLDIEREREKESRQKCFGAEEVEKKKEDKHNTEKEKMQEVRDDGKGGEVEKVAEQVARVAEIVEKESGAVVQINKESNWLVGGLIVCWVPARAFRRVPAAELWWVLAA